MQFIKKHRMHGITLIQVVILISMLSILTFHMLGQLLLLKKRTYNFNEWLHKEILNENQIIISEKTINTENAKWIRFLPDNLGYDCNDGQDLYRIIMENIEITVAI